MTKFLKTIFQGKKTLFLILGLGLFVFLMPLPASAQWWNPFSWAGDWVMDIIYGITLRMIAFFNGLILFILALVFGFIYYIMAGILTWAAQICFRVSVMPGDVGVIGAGWTVTRDFANMFIILILVFIGLATILRIKEYEAKKLFPLLILIALLINFSPVIVGFIVDITNIVTNFFLSQIGSWSSNILDLVWQSAWDYFETLMDMWMNWGNFAETLIVTIGSFLHGIVLVCFWGFASYVLLMISGLFIVRIVILWILVIISPVAFVFYILPATRKYWKEWWQNLIQWAMIGIPIGFFLYLSFLVLSSSTDIGDTFVSSNLGSQGGHGIETAATKLDLSDLSARFAVLLTNLLAPIVSFVMLYIGYKKSRKNMPAFANAVIDGVQKGMKLAGVAAVAVATGGLGLAAGAGIGGGLAGAGGRLATMGARVGQLSEKMPKGFKTISRPFSKVVGKGMELTGKTMESGGERLKTRAEGELTRKTERGGEELIKKNLSTEELAQKFRDADKLPPGTRQLRKDQAVYALLKTKKWDEAVDKGLIDKDKEKAQDMGRASAKRMWDNGIKNPARWLPDGKMAEMIAPEEWHKGNEKTKEGAALIDRSTQLQDPGMAELGAEKQEEGETIHKNIMENILGKVTPDDIGHTSANSLKDKTTIRVIVDTFSGNQLGAIAKNFGRDVVNGIQEEIDRRGETKDDFRKWAMKNPRGAMWTFSNPAQEGGFGPPKGVAGQFDKKGLQKILGEARGLAQTTRSDQKNELRKAYSGNEQIMFRDYYRKDTPTQTKALIREIVTGAGKIIPTEAEIKGRIGSFEKKYDELTKELEKSQQIFEETKKRFEGLKSKPTTPPADLAAVQQEMINARNTFNAGKVKIDIAQKGLLTTEKQKLKDLW